MTNTAADRARAATFQSTRVGDVMSEHIVSCAPEMALRPVAGLMADHRIHSVIVFKGGPERAWGIVSDLDVVSAAAGDLDRWSAGEVAGGPLVTVSPDERLVRAAQLMAEYQTAHLIVVDPATDRPVGVVSSLDVARTLAERERDA